MESKKESAEQKREWHRPSIQELGNLRDFVRTGLRKSGRFGDGQTGAGPETRGGD